jgi:uncharacterized membrane protein YedE/YeeE
MSANVGNMDRILRGILGLVLFFAPLLNIPAIWSNAALAYASMAVGIILVALPAARYVNLQAELMETAFTPIASLTGGILIGLSAVSLMLLRGRIMGATGVLAGVLLPASKYDWTWRFLLLVGMFVGPWVYLLLAGQLPTIQVPASTPLLLLGGFLVGIGVTLGSGCTSGHGVCGMARLSPRSFAATGTFMLTTGLTVYVIRHMIGA